MQAEITNTATNFNDPTTFLMTVQFTDPSGNVSTKLYTLPITNQATDNQAVVNADLDSFEASYNAAQAASSLTFGT